jgi:hypothetical protein
MPTIRERVLELASTALGLIVGAAMIAVFLLFVFGGLFYRTSCPSQASWSFNPIPFISTVEIDPEIGAETTCVTDTATSYVAGKAPLVGGPLRSFIRSTTGQED